MTATNIFSERIVLPLADLITGQSVAKYLRFLQKSQWWSANEIQAFQEQRLQKLIKHSIETVPYYNELFNNNGLKAEYVKTISDLKMIPILTKETIKKEGLERFSSYEITSKKKIQRSSSGSTGEPLFYYATKEAYSMNIAANLRGWNWMGFRLGDRYVKLSQNPRKSKIKSLQDYFSNNLYLATNPLNETNFDHILRKIENYKPKIIRCYPDPLLFLARYKRNKPQFTYQPLAITTTGNTLFPEARMEIENAFKCRVFDSYSCEGNSTVFECPTHTGYHSAEEYGISEVIDAEGQPIKKGIGKLISTDLWNLAHPFIRYDTQDHVEVDSQPCVCGRNHLKFNRIIGRDNEVLKMPSGRVFIVHNFTGFFQTDLKELKRSVDQFQVVKYDDKVVFRLVVNKSFDETVRTFIETFWSKELEFKAKVEVVSKIEYTKSGKRRFIINKSGHF